MLLYNNPMFEPYQNSFRSPTVVTSQSQRLRRMNTFSYRKLSQNQIKTILFQIVCIQIVCSTTMSIKDEFLTAYRTVVNNHDIIPRQSLCLPYLRNNNIYIIYCYHVLLRSLPIWCSRRGRWQLPWTAQIILAANYQVYLCVRIYMYVT